MGVPPGRLSPAGGRVTAAEVVVVAGRVGAAFADWILRHRHRSRPLWQELGAARAWQAVAGCCRCDTAAWRADRDGRRDGYRGAQRRQWPRQVRKRVGRVARRPTELRLAGLLKAGLLLGRRRLEHDRVASEMREPAGRAARDRMPLLALLCPGGSASRGKVGVGRETCPGHGGAVEPAERGGHERHRWRRLGRQPGRRRGQVGRRVGRRGQRRLGRRRDRVRPTARLGVGRDDACRSDTTARKRADRGRDGRWAWRRARPVGFASAGGVLDGLPNGRTTKDVSPG